VKDISSQLWEKTGKKISTNKLLHIVYPEGPDANAGSMEAGNKYLGETKKHFKPQPIMYYELTKAPEPCPSTSSSLLRWTLRPSCLPSETEKWAADSNTAKSQN
jgi:hypothetical protein